MSEMVERVARVVHQSFNDKNIGILGTFEMLSDGDRAVLLHVARAAIAAMREPSERMTAAPGKSGVRAGDYEMSAYEAEQAWKYMIDEALKD